MNVPQRFLPHTRCLSVYSMNLNGLASTRNYGVFALCAMAASVLAWSYWPTFVELFGEWSKNPLYSHGYFIPVFSVVLLWIRRGYFPRQPLKSSWWAVAFLLIGAVLRLGAAHFYLTWPDRASLLFLLLGGALAIGGWPAMRWAGPSILFLFFMIPLPGLLETAMLVPLQRVATIASTNVLQTLGFFAQADGNVIILSQGEMGIVEACSGLRMLTVFMALTVGASMLMQRPIWQKTVIVCSSLFIAILCNIFRIVITGIAFELCDHKSAEAVHDLAGLAMPVVAILLLLLEVKMLDMIYQIEFVESAALFRWART
jgi:exosortase